MSFKPANNNKGNPEQLSLDLGLRKATQVTLDFGNGMLKRHTEKAETAVSPALKKKEPLAEKRGQEEKQIRIWSWRPFKYSASAREKLERIGDLFEVPKEERDKITMKDMVDALLNYDVLIVTVDKAFEIDEKLLRKAEEKAKKLGLPGIRTRMICTESVGTEHVKLEALKRRGIMYTNSPEANINSVSEFIMGYLDMVSKSIHRMDKEVRNGRSEDIRKKPKAFSLEGKTIGLIGAGPTAMATADRARANKMNVICWTRCPEKHYDFDVKFVSLEELLESSEFVSIHLPGKEKKGDSTRNFIRKEHFDMMKKGSYFIAAATRASVIDEEALKEAVDSGRFKGVYLDVGKGEAAFHTNPLADEKYEGLVTLTPHIAGNTDEAKAKHEQTIAEEIRRFFKGEMPLNPVDMLLQIRHLDKSIAKKRIVSLLYDKRTIETRTLILALSRFVDYPFRRRNPEQFDKDTPFPLDREISNAIEEMGRTNPSFLINALRGGHDVEEFGAGGVRALCAGWLGDIRAKRGIPMLIAVAKEKSESTTLRLRCIESLGDIGGKRAVSALKDIIADETIVELRIAAVTNLRKFKSDETVTKTLIDIAKAEGEEKMVRLAAIHALWSIGGEEEVARTLAGIIKGEFIRSKGLNSRYVSYHTRGIDDAEDDPRDLLIRMSFELLNTIKEKCAVTALAALAKDDEINDDVLVEDCIDSLGRIRNEFAAEELVGIHKYLRRQGKLGLTVIAALGRMGDDAVGKLVELYKTEPRLSSEEQQTMIEKAKAEQKNISGAAGLILSGGVFREKAIRAAELEIEKKVEERSEVCGEIIGALEKIGTDAAGEALAEIVGDEGEIMGLRIDALESLFRVRPAMDVEEKKGMVKALLDEIPKGSLVSEGLEEARRRVRSTIRLCTIEREHNLTKD